jgi:hypothetical protein
MDPFGLLIVLTMATFTLIGGGLLVSLVVMECKPGPANRTQAQRKRARRRA